MNETVKEQSNVDDYEIANIENAINYAVQVALSKRRQVEPGIVKIYQDLAMMVRSPLKVLIAGEFKTGKSTFINAILGRELLKSDVVPTTSVVTYLCYGSEEKLFVVFKNNTSAQYPIEELVELTTETSEKYLSMKNQIDVVYVYLNLPILRNLTIIDSPGVNVGIDRHEAATHNVLQMVDFIIWVMSVTAAGKKTEIAEISKLPSYMKPLIIINRIDVLDPDFEDIDVVLKQIGKRIESYCTGYVGISAFQALQAIKTKNNELYEESRFAEFLEILNNKYISEKNFLCKEKVFHVIHERKLMSNTISLKQCEDEMQEAGKWLYKNRNVGRWNQLKIICESRKEYELEIESNLLIKNRLHVQMILEKYMFCFNCFQTEWKILSEQQARSMYQLNQIKMYIIQIYQQTYYFQNYVVQCSELPDFENVKANLLMIREQYRQLKNIIDDIESSIFDKKQEDIKKWMKQTENYTQSLGHLIESDILKELEKFEIV